MKPILLMIMAAISTNTLAGSLYLPSKLSPEIESHIERAFVLANMPIIKRPIPVKHVNSAIEKIRYSEPALASRIRQYLERYTPSVSITHADIKLTAITDDAGFIAINDFGLANNARHRASIAAHWVINEYVAVNAGGVYAEQRGIPRNEESALQNEKNHTPEGSFVSLGNNYIQTDIGFRSHWWSPFQESAMLLSTQAAAPLGITFSNIEPITFLNIGYEIFFARMSKTPGIRSDDRDTVEEGRPKLFGFHMNVAPIAGVSLAVNRLMQFGGASREESLKELAGAFFNPKNNDNKGFFGKDFGNQVSSITTRYTFPGKIPASIYMEYAGEDTSETSGFHFGNNALMFGIHFPRLFAKTDVLFETADWQNGWYTNGNYQDGLRNYESVLGHWGGNQRVFQNAQGARASTLKVVQTLHASATITAKYRTVTNNESSQPYVKGEILEINYAQELWGLIGGLELSYGNTVFDEKFGQLSGFLRW